MSSVRPENLPATLQPPTEVGRIGWFVIGALSLGLGALAHAIAEIVREILGPPDTAVRTSAGGRTGRVGDEATGKVGLVLIGLVTMTVAAFVHAVAGVVKVIWEALHPTPSRPAPPAVQVVHHWRRRRAA
ncbi:hypothetical protein [Kitasatospora sp. NPDC097643]|uniref:hypothetical protein n=1 Tax=Kitasatospora sp. NPDC097643 TaxID=3157230 RepID=UPI00331DE9FB